jgi:DNA-directed RNA polymerase specialized sigma24 family protein
MDRGFQIYSKKEDFIMCAEKKKTQKKKNKSYEDQDYVYLREKPFAYCTEKQLDDFENNQITLGDIARNESNVFSDIPFEELEKVLMLLTEKQLDVFLLRLGPHYLSQRTIADLYGISQTSVRDRLKGATKRIAKYKHN